VSRSSPGRRSTGPRSLGQNFLIDRNIIDVIERLAFLGPDDVVLEVGGGAGILSERLAARTAYLHLIEIDRGLEDGLRAALSEFSNWSLWLGDAVTFDLGLLDPAPTKMVANLPYGVAATVILRTVYSLESIRSWVVMVQKEVGQRFAAAPGSGAYGVPSVLAQLRCEVRVLRPVSRSVFRPVPNVDSVLLGLTRRPDDGESPTDAAAVQSLVHDAFAHRRKALAGSLALARGDRSVRDRAQEALVSLGFPADVRAERLAPADFVALADKLA
jgi:16S rRNA (adenine1518-N6/adenine1519-N6)-dimethyltransferase